MEHYVGLDVSLKLTAICVVDRSGKIEREGVVTSDPETIAAFVKSHAPHVARIGLEAGATSTWLWTELNKMGLPVICIDARHAKAALKMQINKSDRTDAVGIARIMQCGWYKEVRVKDLDSHAIKFGFDFHILFGQLPAARALRKSSTALRCASSPNPLRIRRLRRWQDVGEPPYWRRASSAAGVILLRALPVVAPAVFLYAMIASTQGNSECIAGHNLPAIRA